MIRSLPITEAYRQFLDLPEQFNQNDFPMPVAVVKGGKPVMAVLSWDLYEDLLETLEILFDEELVSTLRSSIREMHEGKVSAWQN